jgi:Holliday junction resolvase RusA-like endonuclease
VSDSATTNVDGWLPLTLDEMPLNIQQILAAEFPIGSELRDWVIGEFEHQCHATFDPPSWSDDTATLFRRWWWFQYEQGEFIVRRHHYLQQMLHPNLSGKASALAQRHCTICSGLLSSDNQYPISMLPIRIAPQSRQSLSQVNWAAFQAAMRDWFEKRNLDLGTSKHLCIAITYVLSEQRNDRDLDNMTKALMDAFSRAVGFDDKDIHHLDVLKLREESTEEYVFIRIGPSHLHNRSTVMVPVYEGAWAVGEALKFQDFMI